MLAIHRARQILLFSVIAIVALVALEFPLRQLVSQRAEITQTSSALAAVRSHNVALNENISSLSKSSVIASIAHQDYGLVKLGQQSYVILPAAGSKTSSDPLSVDSIPVVDVGSTSGSSAVTDTRTTTAKPAGSLWSRMLRRLEFWR